MIERKNKMAHVSEYVADALKQIPVPSDETGPELTYDGPTPIKQLIGEAVPTKMI